MVSVDTTAGESGHRKIRVGPGKDAPTFVAFSQNVTPTAARHRIVRIMHPDLSQGPSVGLRADLGLRRLFNFIGNDPRQKSAYTLFQFTAPSAPIHRNGDDPEKLVIY
jgi:hypothetical protein